MQISETVKTTKKMQKTFVCRAILNGLAGSFKYLRYILIFLKEYVKIIRDFSKEG